MSGCPRSHFHVYTCGIDAGARHAGLSENMTFVRILYSESHIFLADPTTLFVYEMRLIIHRCNTRNLEVPANILEPQHRCPSRCPAVTPPCINSASPHHRQGSTQPTTLGCCLSASAPPRCRRKRRSTAHLLLTNQAGRRRAYRREGSCTAHTRKLDPCFHFRTHIHSLSTVHTAPHKLVCLTCSPAPAAGHSM